MDERLREARKTWTPETLWKLEKNKRELFPLNQREAVNRRHARCMARKRKEEEMPRKRRKEKEQSRKANQPTDRNVSESCNSYGVDVVVNNATKREITLAEAPVDIRMFRMAGMPTMKESKLTPKLNHDSPSPSARGKKDRPMAIWQAIARTLTPFTNSGNGAGDRDTDDQVEPELLSASTEGEDVPMSTPDVSPGLPSEGNTSKTGVPSTQDPLNSASLKSPTTFSLVAGFIAMS